MRPVYCMETDEWMMDGEPVSNDGLIDLAMLRAETELGAEEAGIRVADGAEMTDYYMLCRALTILHDRWRRAIKGLAQEMEASGEMRDRIALLEGALDEARRQPEIQISIRVGAARRTGTPEVVTRTSTMDPADAGTASLCLVAELLEGLRRTGEEDLVAEVACAMDLLDSVAATMRERLCEEVPA